jgi:hypothetical protein
MNPKLKENLSSTFNENEEEGISSDKNDDTV